MTEMDTKDSESESKVSPELLSQLRELVSTYQSVGQLDSAIYWADKVVSLSQDTGDHHEDVCSLGQCLILTRQYHRAAALVMKDELHLSHVGCCYVASKALNMVNEGEQALDIIEIFLEETQTTINEKESNSMKTKAMLSNLHLLKGQILESRDNRLGASESYKMAVKSDQTCVEAMTLLTSHQMLCLDEERELVNDISRSNDSELSELVSHLYWGTMKKYADVKLAGYPLSSLDYKKWNECLKDNSDVRVWQVERLYYNCDFHQAFKLSSELLKNDPYHPTCLPVHVALLLEMEKTSDLFKLSHNLVDLFPEWSVAWYAVGCYYYSTGRQDPARRYLEKSTKQDLTFGPAWLAYGHSFAVENEHDQAMAAYFKAAQLMQGCHLPHLYIGLEYSLTNNTTLAEKFFSQALEIAPNDPFVLHELGVTSFSSGNFERAEKYFSDALLRVESVTRTGLCSSLSDKWESLLNNLGHTYRKLGRYSESISFHQQALVLSPLNPSTYSALGYVQTLVGDLANGVESFHKALGIRREDTFSTNMLTAVIEQLMDTVAPFPGYTDTTPRFPGLASSSPPSPSSPKTPSENSSRDCIMMEDSTMDQTM